MDAQLLKNILEAGLLVAAKPMSVAQLEGLFAGDDDKPNRAEIKEALTTLQSEYEGRGIELVEIASGYRLQSRDGMAHWMARLFEERLPRYSRALLETLVLVAYRQPVTRGEIEEIRGVAVSSNIVKTLLERQWVKEVGHKDVPGKPALLGTTKHFLDYFNLKRLDDLPPLGEIKDLDQIDAVLAESMGIESVDAVSNEPAANDEIAVEATDVDIALEGDASDAKDIQTPDNVDGVVSAEEVVSDVALEQGEVPEGRLEEQAESDNTLLDGVNAEGPEYDSDENVPSDSIDAASDGPQIPTAEDDAAVLGFDETTAESELKRVIADFADEHQQELDAQRQIDSQQLSKPLNSPEEHGIDDSGNAVEDPEAALATETADAEESEDGTKVSAFQKSVASEIADELPKPNDTLH